MEQTVFCCVGSRTTLNPPRSSQRCQTVKSGRDLAGTTSPPQISEIRTRFQHVLRARHRAGAEQGRSISAEARGGTAAASRRCFERSQTRTRCAGSSAQPAGNAQRHRSSTEAARQGGEGCESKSCPSDPQLLFYFLFLASQRKTVLSSFLRSCTEDRNETVRPKG